MSGGRYLPARRDGVCGVEIDGELVLLDTASGALHVLNRVAAAIWGELDGDRDVEQIVARLSEAAGADPDTVREDVAALLAQLGRSGLLAAPPP